ncbi:MAG: flagellar basal body-associated protein FliL [Bacillota bacterium]
MADAPTTPGPKSSGAATSNNTTSINLNKMTTYIIVGLFSLLVTVIIAGAFLIITFKGGTTKVVETKTVVVGAGAGEEVGPLVPLGNEIIVNIPSDDGVEHYLKVNATLELDNEKAKEEVTKRIPQIRDLMITILRSKPKEKIDEKEGKEQIRSEIISTINRYLISGKVKNLYFEDFLIN